MTLDSRDYEKGMKDAISSSKNVEAAMNSLRSPLDKARTGFDAIGHPVETAKKNFEGLKAKVSELAHPLQNAKNKLQESSAAMETQRNRIKVLSAQFDDAKNRVNTLTEAFNKSVRETGATTDASKKLADQLKKAEHEANDAEKELDDYARSVAEAGKNSEESDSKLKKLANTLKKGIGAGAKIAGAALKVTGAGVVAAGAAVGKIVKDSVTAYGEFEQLKGGAEKIFSGMDMSVITRDANDAYKTLNMSASEYFAAINQTGAAFKASMGDEKAYATAKMGMTAIADYASGTGKNIAELNEKYALITRSTASYQSIADQFSGILPQTSKDFLAQAQAAGFLSGKYTELTQVPVAEYQEAVTKMLAKGTDQINLTNNAQEESTKTLTGSLAMTRAAWQNFVTGLSDSEADMSQLTANLIESGGAALKNIVPLVKQALSGIGKAVADLAPALGPELGNLVSDVLPDLVKSALTLVSALADALIANTGPILDAVFEVIGLFVDSLQDPDGLLKLLDAALVIIETLADNLISSLPTLIPAIIAIIMQIAEKLYDPDTLAMLLDSAIAILLAIADGLISSMDVVIEKAPEIIAGLVSALIEAAPKMFDAALSLISKLGEGIRMYLKYILEVGKAIVQGIWQGITNSLEWIKGKIKKWVGNVMDFIKGLFGIHSPSKWAETVIGRNIALGMAEGILDNESAVSDAMNNLTEGVSGEAMLALGSDVPSVDKTISEKLTIDDDRKTGAQAQILALLNQYLPTLAAMKVYLDSGVLVGQLAPGMDSALGRRASYAARGLA